MLIDNVLMRRKVIYISLVFLAVLFGALSCSFTLLLNGERRLYLSDENVKVRLTATSMNMWRHSVRVETILGNVRVNTDELRLVFPIDNRISFFPDEEWSKMVRGVFEVKQDSAFIFRLRGSFVPLSEGRYGGILILPSDFITYNGKSLITDTIEITAGERPRHFIRLLNGEENLYLSQENAKIRLTAWGGVNIRVEVVAGDVSVNTDELKVFFPVDDRISFSYDRERIRGVFEVKQGSAFVCHFSGGFEISGDVPREILILPSDFIMHNGKPLITDTIRITPRR